MTMELKNPRYFRNLLDDRKDPARTSAGFGQTMGRTDAGGPDEGSRIQERMPVGGESYSLGAEP